MKKFETKNLKSGIHSLTYKVDKIVVESNFGSESAVSIYTLDEAWLALAAFNRLIEEKVLNNIL